MVTKRLTKKPSNNGDATYDYHLACLAKLLEQGDDIMFGIETYSIDDVQDIISDVVNNSSMICEV